MKMKLTRSNIRRRKIELKPHISKPTLKRGPIIMRPVRSKNENI
jgi:hypothetical protein